MFDTEFLKRITILYVEDDPMIRNSMQIVFEKLFKHTVIATNGQDGYDRFKLHYERNLHFDIIISDINMPVMNGLEMIEKIRKINEHIPIILTTAHSDSKYFLEAINHNIYHYAIKPIKMKQLALAIQDATMKYFDKKIIENKQIENDRYVEIINQATLVSKTDLSGYITFANELFSIISGYSNEELLGANQRIIRHDDMPTIFFDDLWNTLRAKKVWKGKIKNKAKDGTPYFVHATIFPIFDPYGDKIIEYMAVQYLITEDELEKRDFKKKVIQNIKDSKLAHIELKQENKELKTKLKERYDSSDIDIAMETLNSEKRKNSRLLVQIEHYEKLIEQKVKQEEEIKEKLNRQITILRDEQLSSSSKYSVIKDEKEKLLREIEILQNQVTKMGNINEQNNQRLHNLEDVIKHKEYEILILKEKNNL
jgi:PAS domain S-box-containing protein